MLDQVLMRVSIRLATRNKKGKKILVLGFGLGDILFVLDGLKSLGKLKETVCVLDNNRVALFRFLFPEVEYRSLTPVQIKQLINNANQISRLDRRKVLHDLRRESTDIHEVSSLGESFRTIPLRVIKNNFDSEYANCREVGRCEIKRFPIRRRVAIIKTARSVSLLLDRFWKDLEARLIRSGYDVAFPEEEVNGELTLFDLFERCASAEWVISLRNGLCDVLIYCGVKTICVYPKESKLPSDFYSVRRIFAPKNTNCWDISNEEIDKVERIMS